MASDTLSTVRTEGAILPRDLLDRVGNLDSKLLAMRPQDYDLGAGERLGEATSRAWNRLVGVWTAFAERRARLPDGDPATGETRDHWLRPLFGELGFGRLQPLKHAVDLDGREYPISHMWEAAPLHLVGVGLSLDTRTPGVAGAARSSPHSLVQELLNRSDDHLWGIVTNGLELRLLRDNVSLTRQAYVSFDLEGMFDGDDYATFRLLWLTCHASRFAGERPELCPLERWYQTSITEGTRALERLRGGVQAAIDSFGTGFLAHRANAALRDALQAGDLSTLDYYRQLLRVVYRLLLLFVAEDNDALHGPDAGPEARSRYARYYSTERLRRIAERRRGDAHDDLWQAHSLVVGLLADPDGCPPLGLAPLGGLLFSGAATPDLETCRLTNRAFLDAVRALALIEDTKTRRLRRIDYRNLSSEELGSVYESLLELVPELDVNAAHFSLAAAAGNARKTTGSYYTPTSLINELLDTALDPVMDDRTKNAPDADAAVAALLDLKVVDPAVGSGHFLVAAAHRIARRVAALRTGDDEPSPEATRAALREVTGRCLYGVDVNPMAAELCKVALWMEALEPGKPLSFLDAHVQVGNSLLGTTPDLLAGGIPDDAFKPIEGDDKDTAKTFRARNKKAAAGQSSLFEAGTLTAAYPALARQSAALDDLPDDTLDGIAAHAAHLDTIRTSDDYRNARLAADAWCAAFVWPKTSDAPDPPTSDTVLALAADPESVSAATRGMAEALAGEYRFFHWHLAFPHVFQDGGGFDVVLANPPWERVKLQNKEFFATRDPEIADAPNAAAASKLIDALKDTNSPLYAEYLAARREAEGASHFLRTSGRYPLCGRGDVNLYTVFAELMRTNLSPLGRTGMIVPSGIATDDTTKFFFQDLVEARSLVSLYDFENKDIFPAVHSSYKFCLLTLAGSDDLAPFAEFVFFAHDTAELSDPDRRFTLTPEDFALLNPNTRTCPIFRTTRDAELTKAIYRRVPVLVDEGRPDGNPWGITFMRMIDMSNDSGLFRTRDDLEAAGWTLDGNVFTKGDARILPLYEAKMVHHFDHRFGDYDLKDPDYQGTDLPNVPDKLLQDPGYANLPRYWVAAKEVDARLEGRWPHDWLLGWRDITNATNERTVIAAVVPRTAVGNNYPLMLTAAAPRQVACNVADQSSFVHDYVARQKVGGTHLNFFVYTQLPVLPPSTYDEPAPWDPDVTLAGWIVTRVLELTYTAWDLQPFARDLGYDGPPFRWDPERRFALRCELDAAFFHLYGLTRDETAYVMDTFPIVRKHDEKAHAAYRTKDTILQLYDALTHANETATPYATILTPPPAHPTVAHPLA